MLAVGVYAEKGEYDSLFLSNYIDVYVKDALKRVPGVGDVMIFGERKYSMRLWLDPRRLAAAAMTAGDVVNALREQNVQVAAGASGRRRRRDGQMYQISVRAAGRLREPREFDNIIVKAGADGALVRLKDVGRAGARRRDLRVAAALPGHRRRRLRRHPAAVRQRARRRARRPRRARSARRSSSRRA